MIEFKRHVFEFKLDGKVHSVKHPTVADIENFQAKAGEDESIATTIEFLSELGLDAAVARSMESSHLQTLVETVSGAAKP